MKPGWLNFVLFLIGLLMLSRTLPALAQTQASPPVVHAILFYSPTCGHCEYVITEVLPPLAQQYGDQLQIIGVNVASENGQALFLSALQKFDLQSGGVPFLVIGDTYLFGSVDIPEKFPGMIEELLARGGVGWPDMPGMEAVLEVADIEKSDTTALSTPEASPVSRLVEEQSDAIEKEDLGDKLARDPEGNTLSIIVLVIMIASAVWALLNYRQIKTTPRSDTWKWAIPVLCVVGLGVVGYLSYVETTHVEAVCGPVGDCNTVQQSKYAVLFGVLPVGVLGIIGYIGILAAWVVNTYGKKEWRNLATVAIFGMSIFGLLFSMYLTFLEPFVIGATCIWCLSSAVIMTAVFWLSLPRGKEAVSLLARK